MCMIYQFNFFRKRCISFKFHLVCRHGFVVGFITLDSIWQPVVYFCEDECMPLGFINTGKFLTN